MDTFNWMMLEMITREQVRERLNEHHLELPKAPTRQNPILRRLASSLVRLGLRLDPAAGEVLGRLDLSLVHTKGRN